MSGQEHGGAKRRETGTDLCHRISVCSYGKHHRPDGRIGEVDEGCQQMIAINGMRTFARRLRLGPLRKFILKGSGSSEDLKEDWEGGGIDGCLSAGKRSMKRGKGEGEGQHSVVTDRDYKWFQAAN